MEATVRAGPMVMVCARCGGPVGLDEPAWVERADGRLVPSPELTSAIGDRGGAARIWHLLCWADEFAA